MIRRTPVRGSRLAVVCGALALAATAQTQNVRPRSALSPPAADSTTAADYDARRAAAGRLLIASRFRARQAVLIKESLHAAAAEMAGDCLNRAVAGRDMRICEAMANPGAAMKARLAATESDLLDEVMAASQTIYARHFTAAEMDEIARFFRTPVGQRYGADYPQILVEVQVRKREILRRYLTAAAAVGKAAPPARRVF